MLIVNQQKRIINTLLMVLLIIVFGCAKMTKDDVIKKYNKVDFSVFKNKFIAIRSTNLLYTTFIINDTSPNWPYFVKYNNFTKKIIKKWSKGNSNIDFTEKQIKQMIDRLKKLKLFLIKVDKDNNVFINPYNINSPPLFLRVNKYNNIDTIKKGFIFIHYKNNWYIKM